jgi:hypothetical protein
MSTNRALALVLVLAGVYLLVFHWLLASTACVGPSLCLPPRPVTPLSPVIVAWADLGVGLVCLLVGGIGLVRRAGGGGPR